MYVCAWERDRSFIHACIRVQGAEIKNGLWNTPWHENYRYLGHKLSSYVTLSLSLFLLEREGNFSEWERERERKWEIIFPVQTNGLWLHEAGLELEWSEKQCTFAFKSIWPAKAPFPISKTRQLQPITSIHFPFSFSFLSCSCMQKRKCLNDSVICDNYRWSTEAKRLSLTLKWFNLFIF